MRKIVEIDGREVEFLSTAAIPRLYRVLVGRDVFVDMKKISTMSKEPGGLPMEAITIFEDLAFCMAKNASGASIPDTTEEWLGQFDGMMTTYNLIPIVAELWAANNERLDEAKKK